MHGISQDKRKSNEETGVYSLRLGQQNMAVLQALGGGMPWCRMRRTPLPAPAPMLAPSTG